MRALVLFLALCSCDAAPAATIAPPVKDAAAAPAEPDTIVIPSITGPVATGWVPDFSGFAGTSTGCMRSTGAGRFVVGPALAEGDTLLSLVVAMAGNLSADVTITSLAVAPNGDRFLGTVGSLDVPNVATGFHDYPIDLVDTLIVDGVSHWFEFGADQPGACVGAVRLTYQPGA
jgi:hypothetical protein